MLEQQSYWSVREHLKEGGKKVNSELRKPLFLNTVKQLLNIVSFFVQWLMVQAFKKMAVWAWIFFAAAEYLPIFFLLAVGKASASVKGCVFAREAFVAGSVTFCP